MRRRKEYKPATPPTELPKGILVSDTKYPSYKSKDGLVPYNETQEFELWWSERFGWCIPTLLIRNASRRSGPNTTARTYAVTLAGDLVRIGHGPHVKRTVKVYIRKSRKAALAPFVEIMTKGAEGANEARDVRSTRMLRGSMRRAGRDPLNSLFGLF